MSDIENEVEFSLAQLAEIDTSDLKAQVSRLPPAGIFLVRGVDAKAGESRQEGKPPLFNIAFESEILEAKPLDKDKDPESLVGGKLKDRYILWPSDFQEALQLLMGRYMVIGLEHKGRLGGVEGGEPGWLDNYPGAIHRIRVRHFTDKNGVDRAGFDWLPAEDAKSED